MMSRKVTQKASNDSCTWIPNAPVGSRLSFAERRLAHACSPHFNQQAHAQQISLIRLLFSAGMEPGPLVQWLYNEVEDW